MSFKNILDSERESDHSHKSAFIPLDVSVIFFQPFGELTS